ncbi:hypothetical protein, partial [Klebsiella pneumoniae]|uniref:hypothetical protein n=1 Tax=Klebsiella pneumoniae TaxID=573 RepID=UPI00272EEB37
AVQLLQVLEVDAVVATLHEAHTVEQVFANASTSFKPNSGLDANSKSFKPEEGVGYEVGLKTEVDSGLILLHVRAPVGTR